MQAASPHKATAKAARGGLRQLAAAALMACFGAPALAAGLSEILELARRHDPQLSAARHAAAAGAERGVQGRAALLPSVNLSGNLRQNRDHISVGAVDYTARAITLQMVQPIVRPMLLRAARGAELQSELAALQYLQAQQELVLRVVRGYFEVLQAEDVLGTVRAQKMAMAAQLAQATKGMEVGTVPITDVNEAQARTDLAAAQEIAAVNDVEVKRRTLERAISRPLPPLNRLKEEARVTAYTDEELSQLGVRAAADSLAVRAAALNRDIARAESDRQAATQVPTLDLVVTHSDTRNANFGAFGGTDTRQVSAGVEFAVPLFQGGAIDSRRREALANLARADDELEAARRQALLDGHQAMLGVRSGNALVVALQQARRSSETQLASSRHGLQVGVRTRIDVLNAEQQLHATLRDLAAARYQTLVSGVQLRAAAGQLGDADVAALNALLERP